MYNETHSMTSAKSCWSLDFFNAYLAAFMSDLFRARFVGVTVRRDFATTCVVGTKRGCETIIALSEKLFHDRFSSMMRHRCNGADYLDTSLATVLSFRSLTGTKIQRFVDELSRLH